MEKNKPKPNIITYAIYCIDAPRYESEYKTFTQYLKIQEKTFSDFLF